jgi:hypothetical protein
MGQVQFIVNFHAFSAPDFAIHITDFRSAVAIHEKVCPRDIVSKVAG